MGTATRGRSASRAAAEDPADPALHSRRLPAQERGRAAFERILSTAARLIEEGGIERLNTNLVAAESGVNISTVYKYFPNKLAILATLFQRQSDERNAVVFEGLDQLPGTQDWQALMDRTIDRVVARRRSQTGHVALLRAMRSSPELSELCARIIRRSSERLGALLSERAGLPRARSLLVARTLVEMEVAMLDWWESDEGRRNPRIVSEFKVLVRSYLGTYLDR